ncbi:MAG: protein translocase subunit SecF [Nocardioidaceae bacterium]
MGKLSRIGHDLYQGHVSIDFVGRRWLWYGISAVLVIVSVLGLTVKGFNLGIEFEGGVEYQVAVAAGTADDSVPVVRDAIAEAAQEHGISAAEQPIVNSSGTNGDKIRVQTESLDPDETNVVASAIKDSLGVTDDDINRQTIGPSWGREIADRAIKGLVVFLVLVVLLIAAYTRQWKMSIAAVVALIHDLLITSGVYALSGFEVTPATVTGLLTILGFSLYDTVVVFDKVRENTKNLAKTKQTYREAANLAVNQTLVRSINTSIVALLPVGALLYVGVFTLGSGALKDLALALFVGMAVGAYSSIFIATPIFVQLKEFEPGVKAGDKRAMKHRSRREVDPFASVPAFSEDMPIHDDPGAAPEHEDGTADAATRGGNRPVPAGPATKFTPEARPSTRPVTESASANRPQPKRAPRSQRKG